MRVSTFLWFTDQAEKAAKFYTDLFADSSIIGRQRTADGTVTSVSFDLAGQHCIAFNGGSPLTFTPAVSMFVECRTQDEIDAIWAGLTDGGSEGPGGSLTDRFGITWQVMPAILNDLLDGGPPETSDRILTAVHGMKKIDIQGLIDAGSG
jgi:predicted 3-demethylubiquinone-9 3-methyltransferase (glyoxalase superfamily)